MRFERENVCGEGTTIALFSNAREEGSNYIHILNGELIGLVAINNIARVIPYNSSRGECYGRD